MLGAEHRSLGAALIALVACHTVAFLDRQVANRSSTREAWSLLEKPAKLTRFGVDGAEMTDRYTLRTHDGALSAVRQMLRTFVRGDRAFLVTVLWNDARGGRPDEATAMLEALTFYAPIPTH
jgi:hypothetical protein